MNVIAHLLIAAAGISILAGCSSVKEQIRGAGVPKCQE
jgi:hypothetical protein